MAANTYSRYIWLLNTILQAKEITFDEISRRWQCSSLNVGDSFPHRTFQSHLRKIEEIFDVNICCKRTSYGYVYYVEDVDDFFKDNIRQWMVNSFNLNNVVKECAPIKDRIIFEEQALGSAHLNVIIDAMKFGKELEIEHQTFAEDTLKHYHLQPYCLKQYKQRWYLLAYTTELSEIRHFALDRILKLKQTNVDFLYPQDFSPRKYYKDIVGIYVDDSLAPQTVRIRAYGTYVKYLRSLPLHSTQDEVYTNEKYSDFEYKVKITDNLIKEILFHDSSIQVLEPESLRRKIIDKLKEISEKYE